MSCSIFKSAVNVMILGVVWWCRGVVVFLPIIRPLQVILFKVDLGCGNTKNQLPILSGSALKVPDGGVGSYPLSSQAPTHFEVELGCDNNSKRYQY
jgi:hypothetical protein